MNRDKLLTAINEKLDAARIKDACPNGLQVEGREEVAKVIVSVSASEKLFKEAATRKADMIIVHHGLFWNNASRVVRGSMKRRLNTLLQNDITLAAYHLPLDKHNELGNNIQLAKLLGLENISSFGDYKGVDIGWVGNLTTGISPEEFQKKVTEICNGDVVRYGAGKSTISKVAIVSGGAADCVYEAAIDGVDAFITGEVSEFVVRFAEEESLHYYAAGHYATERFGVKALGEWIASNFNLEVTFVDLPVPV